MDGIKIGIAATATVVAVVGTLLGVKAVKGRDKEAKAIHGERADARHSAKATCKDATHGAKSTCKEAIRSAKDERDAKIRDAVTQRNEAIKAAKSAKSEAFIAADDAHQSALMALKASRNENEKKDEEPKAAKGKKSKAA